jgi:hypothetical protein
MDEAFALQALADAGLDEQLDRPVLEHAGADALLDVLAAAILEHHRLDSLEMEQVPEQQAGRARADNSHLRAH